MSDDEESNEPLPDSGVKVLSLVDAKNNRRAGKGIVIRDRRYETSDCKHEGTAYVDETLDYIECGDCGAHLNPIWFIMKLAKEEGRWIDKLREYQEMTRETAGRVRTRCTHCGEMTPIRLKGESPRTWLEK